MNDDNLNYRFRLITFNDNISVKDPNPDDEIPSVPEEPKPPKYTLSADNSDAPDAAQAEATPQPVRLSQSTTGILAKRNSKNELLKRPRNTISVEDFDGMITSQDNMYPDKLIECYQINTKDKNLKEKVKNIRKKRKTQNHYKWQKDVKVIYTSETTKTPRQRRTHRPPDHYAYRTHEFREDFESLYKNDYYHHNVFKNNPAVYFQSSGDCRRDCRGIFGKFKKSREKEHEQESCDHHFPVANMGDYCDDKEESPSGYDCTHLPHLNVVGFPQENKITVCQPRPQPQPQDYQTCGRSLNTLHFDDVVKCCPPVYETGQNNNYEYESKNICDYEPTAKTSENKATTKKTSAKLCCQSEEKSTKQGNAVPACTRSTTPKKTKPSEYEPDHESTSNSYLKYSCYAIAVIVFFPCVLIFSLCWLATYPLRPREVVPSLSKQSPQNNNGIRKPRERNLCHLNRAPKVLANSIDNWSTIKDVVACACKSALPCQKKETSRSCSPSSPPHCNKGSSSKVCCKKACNEVNFDACPIKIPACAIKSYGQRHPDTSQQYRMFYGGALRGWLMKPLNCYGVTCNGKNRISCRNVCPTTVMPVKTTAKKTSLTNAKKGKTEKKAVKFSDEKATPVQRPRPARKGEMRPCTDPRPSKKPCRVCCQPIRPELDPSSVGLVHYGSKDGDEKEIKKKKEDSKKKKKKTDSKKKKKKVESKKKEKPKKVKKEKKKKKAAKSSKTTSKKSKSKSKKKKKKKKKGKEENPGLIRSIIDAEDEAWGNEEIKCDEIWVRTLRKKPWFWVYERWPGLYPCFLQWHSCCTNCFSCCIMCLSTIAWCPLLVCVYICFKFACKK